MAERIAPITMPKFGLAMTEGIVVGWLAAIGDSIASGQELVEIETTKITNVYESPVSGVLRRQLASQGETLSVGALIGVVAAPSVSDAEIDTFIAGFEAQSPETASDDEEKTTPANSVITLGPLRLRVQDSGAAQPGRLPVILIHGFAGSLDNWMLVQPALAAVTRVVAFDLPGHGESSKSVGDGTVTYLAEVTRALLRALSIEKAHVVGHSLGGAVAIELAALAPEAVESLTLIAPAGIGESINAAFIDGVLSATTRKTLQPALSLLVHDKALISRQMVEEMIRFKRLDGALDGLRTLAAASFDGGHQTISLGTQLERFAGKTDLLWGENDEILPASQARDVAGNVTVTIYPQTGHMPQLERSGAVAAALKTIVTG
ncbi:acetoin dehydrogenase dihydrolipoyllysine-residue acetyltransferase subunit [Asaia sp. BMEF1]|uniref:acetoin dehydrogenase dihydrolipoyllysine-residue acetyltransferase subunit n=1 Tax=Asaia sp. BMEF1 TaxID=3155932 RepID=UPI003F677D1E